MSNIKILEKLVMKNSRSQNHIGYEVLDWARAYFNLQNDDGIAFRNSKLITEDVQGQKLANFHGTGPACDKYVMVKKRGQPMNKVHIWCQKDYDADEASFRLIGFTTSTTTMVEKKKPHTQHQWICKTRGWPEKLSINWSPDSLGKDMEKHLPICYLLYDVLKSKNAFSQVWIEKTHVSLW